MNSFGGNIVRKVPNTEFDFTFEMEVLKREIVKIDIKQLGEANGNFKNNQQKKNNDNHNLASSSKPPNQTLSSSSVEEVLVVVGDVVVEEKKQQNFHEHLRRTSFKTDQDIQTFIKYQLDFPKDLVIFAVEAYPSSEGEVEQFLKNYKKLEQLGFSSERIKEALLVQSNDFGTALDYLTKST